MKKAMFKRVLPLVFVLLAGSSLYLAYDRYYRLTYQPLTYTETAAQLSNPYQGWYRIYGYTLSDTGTINSSSIVTSYQKDPDTRLALLEINLRNYPSGAISSAGLAQLQTIFSSWQDSGKQLIVRFLYDWDGKAKQTEPSDLSIITGHMSQVGEIVNQYKDCIYLLQGIFVGNCGEMNSSNYMSVDSMCTLLRQLASVTDSSIFLSVRTPAHWRTITESYTPLSADDAFTGTTASRLGLFNDGMLGSGNDLGTYGDTSLSEADSYSDKGTREEELQFQDQLCSYVPNGGEVVIDNSYNDLENAISDLSRMHVSYLDYDYDTAVLNKWKSATYTGDDVFDGSSGYDYIGSHLGYRYVLRSSACTFDTWEDDTASLTLEIENTGFSSSYRSFSVSVLTVNTESQETFETAIDTDSRYWASQSSVSLSLPLDVRSYATGSYAVYFKITDPSSGEQIALANSLDQSDYGYRIASLELAK